MNIIKVLPSGFASNSYILTQDGAEAVVIDPAQPRITNILKQNGLICKYVLLTHGHFDHVGGCGALYNDGAKIICGESEKDFIRSPENTDIFGGVYIPEFKIDRTVADGENFSLCGIGFKAMFTPGHTAGGVCYITGDNIFSGDTLFRCSVGRTDLPTGDHRALSASLKKLFALDGDYKVYCGHDSDTTLDYERKYNPYARF